MGYWSTNETGNSLVVENTGMVWGDAPADAMDEAIAVISKAFKNDVGRLPTKAEIRAGLEFALSSYEEV